VIDRSLAVEIAVCGTIEVLGEFQRHVSSRVQALSGSLYGGRWAAPKTFPVLYLARPPESVVVEAYRHLVDDDPDMTAARVRPRRLLTCDVKVSQILDLRDPTNLSRVRLTMENLTTDPGHYVRCNRVGHAAHQLGLHGVIAPAATGMGETLALFEDHLPPEESPILSASEMWNALPADPRTVTRPAS